MRIMSVGDVHAPFTHKQALAWVIKLAHEFKPDVIVQVGDALDQFSFSRYPRAQKLDPAEEINAGRKTLVGMWSSMPRCKKYQMMGNHDDRMKKLAENGAPELVGPIEEYLEGLYKFPGVETVKESELEVDGIIFQHGHRAKLGDHAKYNQCSTVVGHSHNGGVVSLRNRLGIYWELNCGFLGEIDAVAFKYLVQKKINTTTLGVGLIDELGPRFVPYPGEAA